MRINENIFKGEGNFLDNKYTNYYQSEIIKIENKILYAKVDNRALFYILVNISDYIEERFTISANIYNGGNIPLIVEVLNVGGTFSPKLVNPGEKFKLEHSASTTVGSVPLRIFCEESGVLAFYFKNIKFEKGDKATPYIPSKNILEPSKQSIFMAGGDFKEVYPV